MSGTQFAQVIVDLRLDKPLDYQIPFEMVPKIRVGSRVEIPVRGKNTLGFVINIKDHSPFSEVKSILRLAEEEMITPDLFQLALWMSEYYLTPLRKVLKTLLPASVRQEKQAKTQYFVMRAKTKEELAKTLRGTKQAAVL